MEYLNCNKCSKQCDNELRILCQENQKQYSEDYLSFKEWQREYYQEVGIIEDPQEKKKPPKYWTRPRWGPEYFRR